MVMYISSSFVDLARDVGIDVVVDGDGFEAADGGGEIRYVVAATPQGFLLTRAERAGDAKEVMLSDSLDDVQRYLATIFGFDYRASRKLPIIRRPYQWDEAAAGFAPMSLDDRWATLVRADGYRLRCAFVDRSIPHPVIQFSYVADQPIEDIIHSYRAEDGRPLFGAFVD